MNMQLQLQDISVSQQIMMQNKLLSIFDINSAGCAMRELWMACVATMGMMENKSSVMTGKGKDKGCWGQG